VDILSAGATGGAATIATVSDYVSNVAGETVECLTDENRVQAHISETLRQKFDATLNKESEWIYWDL
jgi:hypothetical protein